MTLLGHECASIGPPTTPGSTPWALLPKSRGHPNSCTIIHDFSSFRAIFQLLEARTSLGSAGCMRIPHGALDLHFLPTFVFSWLAWQDPRPRHECAFRGPPTTRGSIPWALVPSPRGRPDSCTIIHNFSSFRPIFRLLKVRQVFSPLTSLGSAGCLRIPHGASDLHFLPSFAFPGLIWHDPR